MTNIPAVQPPAFIDNPHAPDVFADNASGIFVFAGNVRLTFESLRVNHISSPGPASRVVIGRLVMPLDAAKGLRDLLIDVLGRLDAAPSTQIQGPPTLQ